MSDELKSGLILVGLLFVVVSIILLPLLRKKSERGDAAIGLIGGIWFVILFGLGSWLVSVVLGGGLEWVFNNIGCGWFSLIVFGGIFLYGCGVVIIRRFKPRPPVRRRTPDFTR